MQGATEPPNDTETTDTDFQTAFVRIVRVLSIGMMVFVLVVLFFPVGHKFAIFGAFVAMISSLEFVIHQSNKRQSIESWMRWVPVFWAMLIYSFSVYQNNLYPITALPTVLAINYIFLPRAAGRIVSMAAFSVAFLPLARGVEVDMAMWIRLITFSVIGVMILEFVANIGYRMFRSLEVSRQKLRVALDESSSLNHQLERAKEAAETANHSKDEFLASMSHELRTPLASIIGNTELLLDEIRDSEQNSILRSIHRSGTNNLNLINDLLDLSKIESGKFNVDETAYSLQQLLQHVIDLVSVHIQDMGLTLKVEQLNHEKNLLAGDDQRIKQILINFLSNAVKFTGEGTITLMTKVEEQDLVFSVADQGVGIKPENMGKLFKRFEQEDSSISRRFGGTGLGLYISRNLAELMGGEVSATSVYGEGSIFTLRLPYRPTDQLDVIDPNVLLNEQSVATNEFLDGSVLLAEDIPAMQLLIRRMVEKLGLEVTVVENGELAVKMAQDKVFDLILMDMQMPVMDGIEATRQIKSMEGAPPIIALTANVMKQHRDAFESVGCEGFLEKPIDRKRLREVLGRYLSS